MQKEDSFHLYFFSPFSPQLQQSARATPLLSLCRFNWKKTFHLTLLKRIFPCKIFHISFAPIFAEPAGDASNCLCMMTRETSVNEKDNHQCVRLSSSAYLATVRQTGGGASVAKSSSYEVSNGAK